MTSVDKRPAFEVPAELATPVPVDAPRRRPVATVVGAALVVLRVLGGVIWLIALTLQWPDVLSDEFDTISAEQLSSEDARAIAAAGLTVVLVIGGVILLVELVLAVLIYLGWNWPRVVVMVFATLSISGAFAAWWAGDQEITLQTTLLTLSLDILVMLALSSRAARDYARGRRRRG
ncbi:hypothetical protein [Agromyces sp. Marseille-P2726]|uniref:hypothetical protein n=1 Tax=Agromyces sp. Marseille-P2726 TaxID=2709132 RepID=UPI0015700E27|nr:hypothetical protein [Agromyces sp. Marseille-P2726]